MINPDLFQEVTQLADLLRAKFSPTEFIPGCLVKSVADKSQYATNNGWIEAVCGQHNQQRVRWKSNETVAVNDYVDVLYFPDRRLFEAYGLGGSGAIAGAVGGNAWPLAGQNLLEGVNYATATLLIAAMTGGDIGYLGARSSSEAVTANEAGITLRGVSASAVIFTTTFTVTDPTTLQDIKAIHSGAANTIGFDVSDSTTLIDCIGIADSTGTSARGLNVTGSAQVTARRGYYEAQNGTAVDVFADASATVFLDGPTLFSGTFGGSGTILGWYLDTTGASHFVYRTGGTTEDITFNNGNLAFGSGTAITGLQASQAEVDAGTDAARIVTPLTLRTTPHGIIKVKNTSGVTVTDGMVGHITYIAGAGQEFRLTITSSADLGARACYVVTGGANNADIYVVTHGRFNLTYSGSAPAIGNYLIFSSTAGAVVAQTYMSPEVMAIAQAAGAAGLVDAMLLTETKPAATIGTANLYACSGGSDSDFISTINGAPAGSTLVYGAVTSGAANTIKPSTTGFLAKLVLHNTTRGTSALISDVNTGTSTITLTAAVPAGWVSTDAITCRSQTNTGNPSGGARFYDFEITSTELNPLARMMSCFVQISDTGGVGALLYTHPYQANSGFKQWPITTQTTLAIQNGLPRVPLFSNRFCMAWDVTGSATATVVIRLWGQDIAAA